MLLDLEVSQQIFSFIILILQIGQCILLTYNPDS